MHPLPLSAHRRRGYTLTEVAIVLGVIGVVIAAIWTAATVVNEKTRLSQALNQANIIAQNMTSFLQSGYGVIDPGDKTDITQTMITSGIIPPWAQTPPGNGTTGQNPWDQAGFHMWWVQSNPFREYRMSFYNVGSERSCIGLLTGMTSCTAGQPGCPVRIVTAGTSGNFTAGGTNLTNTQLTSARLQNLCGPAKNDYSGGGGANSVEFDFQN